jgi:hypothetical protein
VTFTDLTLLNRHLPGVMREDSPDYARSRFADPEATALKDASGNYITGSWQAILEAEEWKALATEWKRRRAGQTFSAHGTKKHLLSGLLRCGCIRPDGSVCNRPLVGTRVYSPARPPPAAYKCPGRAPGLFSLPFSRLVNHRRACFSCAITPVLAHDGGFVRSASRCPRRHQPCQLAKH